MGWNGKSWVGLGKSNWMFVNGLVRLCMGHGLKLSRSRLSMSRSRRSMGRSRLNMGKSRLNMGRSG